jgi:hypothetical protein
MQQIRCNVSNCTFYGTGNYCQASEIIVQASPFSDDEQVNNEYMSAILHGEVQTTAGHSAETFWSR